MVHIPPRCLTLSVRTLSGLLLLGLLGWMPAARADSVTCTGPGAVALSSFGTVYVPSSAPVGSTFGPVATASATFSCSKFKGATTAAITATMSSSYSWDTPVAGVITFPTNLIGVALQLTPSNPDTSGHTSTTFPAGTITAPALQTTQTYSAQLVKTVSGAVAAGSLDSITLIGNYTMTLDGGNGSLTNASSLSLGSGTIKAAGCNLLNVPVTLPVVFASQLSSAGATNGRTPVSLNLVGCPASVQVFISFSGTAATIGGTPSATVLASNGTAQNVGVQLLDSGSPSAPVNITGSVKTALGIPSSSGNLSATYYAQYYATGAAGSGSVNATATYTLTYQ